MRFFYSGKAGLVKKKRFSCSCVMPYHWCDIHCLNLCCKFLYFIVLIIFWHSKCGKCDLYRRTVKLSATASAWPKSAVNILTLKRT